MDIDKIVYNTEQRFKTAESESFRSVMGNGLKGILRATIRGGILGGDLGYAIGGDLESFKIGIAGGAIIDNLQNHYRLISIIEKKGTKKYEEIKQEWKDLGFM